jgi:hypothetical protein
MTARTFRRLVAVAILVLVIGTVAVQATAQLIAPRTWRKVRIVVRDFPCAEDEPWLRGRGDFDGKRWSEYVCVHQDRVKVRPKQ